MDPLKLSGSLFLQTPESLKLGEDRMRLLIALKEEGSISQAARKANLSYKTAWDTIHFLANLHPHPLIQTAVGGKGGGGAFLTEAGEKMLATWREFTRIHEQFLGVLEQNFGSGQAGLSVLRRMVMQTSARNVFQGKIVRIQSSSVQAEILIQLASGEHLAAQITQASLEKLGLREEMPVQASLKASQVMLFTGEEEPLISARNRLKATIEAIHHDEIGAVVDMGLQDQTKLAASITNESLKRLGLAEGQAVWACFKASSVILGLEALG